jgi:hypothetical protein
MNTEKIIVRREPKRNGSGIILFLPESYNRDSRWKIEYFSTYDNMHGDCEHDYYLECTPINTDYDEGDDIKQILSNYVRYIRTLPNMEDYSYKRVYRISRK